MSDKNTVDRLHKLKNHLSVILGFADLVLESVATDGAARADVLEIKKAATAALAEVDGLGKTEPR